MRYTSWEQVDTHRINAITELPLRQTKNGRLSIYQDLEERLGHSQHDAGKRLPYEVIDLYHIENKSEKDVATSLTISTGRTIHSPLVGKILTDYNIPRKTVSESSRGKQHTYSDGRLALESARLMTLLPQYDAQTRDALNENGLRLLDQVPVRGELFNHLTRMQRYASLELHLRREGIANTVAAYISRQYHDRHMSVRELQEHMRSIDGAHYSARFIKGLFKDLNIPEKSRSVALTGKTAGIRAKPDPYAIRLRQIHEMLPEQNEMAATFARTVHILDLPSVISTPVSEAPSTWVPRMEKYVSLERALGASLPLYVFEQHILEDKSLTQITHDLSKKANQAIPLHAIRRMLKDFRIKGRGRWISGRQRNADGTFVRQTANDRTD